MESVQKCFYFLYYFQLLNHTHMTIAQHIKGSQKKKLTTYLKFNTYSKFNHNSVLGK